MLKKIFKYWELILAIIWAALGIVELSSEEVSKFGYVCLLVCFLTTLLGDFVEKQSKDRDDDNKPPIRLA